MVFDNQIVFLKAVKRVLFFLHGKLGKVTDLFGGLSRGVLRRLQQTFREVEKGNNPIICSHVDTGRNVKRTIGERRNV